MAQSIFYIMSAGVLCSSLGILLLSKTKILPYLLSVFVLLQYLPLIILGQPFSLIFLVMNLLFIWGFVLISIKLKLHEQQIEIHHSYDYTFSLIKAIAIGVVFGILLGAITLSGSFFISTEFSSFNELNLKNQILTILGDKIVLVVFALTSLCLALSFLMPNEGGKNV